MERIKCVAIMDVFGRLFSSDAPARHHNVLHQMKNAGADHVGSDQGFLTSDGRYVDREEALKIATAAGQMKPRQPGQYNGPELFSEDLW